MMLMLMVSQPLRITCTGDSNSWLNYTPRMRGNTYLQQANTTLEKTNEREIHRHIADNWLQQSCKYISDLHEERAHRGRWTHTAWAENTPQTRETEKNKWWQTGFDWKVTFSASLSLSDWRTGRHTGIISRHTQYPSLAGVATSAIWSWTVSCAASLSQLEAAMLQQKIPLQPENHIFSIHQHFIQGWSKLGRTVRLLAVDVILLLFILSLLLLIPL